MINKHRRRPGGKMALSITYVSYEPGCPPHPARDSTSSLNLACPHSKSRESSEMHKCFGSAFESEPDSDCSQGLSALLAVSRHQH